MKKYSVPMKLLAMVLTLALILTATPGGIFAAQYGEETTGNENDSGEMVFTPEMDEAAQPKAPPVYEDEGPGQEDGLLSGDPGFVLLAADAPQDPVEVSTWDGLQNAINSAPDDTATTIVLISDVKREECTATSVPNCIQIKAKKVITLDLNGYSLESDWLKQNKKGSSYHVIEVADRGKLTITDSGSNKTGKISGGYADNGGGIYVNGSGNCTVLGGTITGNKAGDNGGGIYAKGEIRLDGAVIEKNTAGKSGGGFYSTNDATISIDNSVIANNTAGSNGGGLYIGFITSGAGITKCSIKENTATDGSGGGIYIDAKSAQLASSLVIDNCDITDNECGSNGGGICANRGEPYVQNSRVNGNKAAKKGGGIFIGSSCRLDASGSEFCRNSAGTYGGGVCNEHYAILTYSLIGNNTAGSSGGGAYCTAGNSLLSFWSCRVTGNDAPDGAGTYADCSFYVQGGTVISDNAGTDLTLAKGRKIRLNNVGPLTADTNIGVTLKNGTGSFTDGFSDVMPAGATPDTYFYSPNYTVTLLNGEGFISPDLDEYHKFLKLPERINTNVNRLTPGDWMSGVSGERYLSEINIPGTHDTSMYKISHKGTPSGKFGASFAQTQKEYLFEQLESGARVLDIRMNNQYCSDEISLGTLAMIGTIAGIGIALCFGPAAAAVVGVIGTIVTTVLWINDSTYAIFSDDGVNLWVCHGKTLAGTYYALGPDGKNLSVATELEWIKEFLQAHPTETLIVNFQPENQDMDKYSDIVLQRFKKMLEELSEEINPSTGKPYVYWEDGKVCEPFTYIPQLKQCRGQMIVWGSDENVKIFGGLRGTLPTSTDQPTEVIRPNGGFGDNAEKRILNLSEFFNSHNVKIPRDAYKENGLHFRYSVGTNGTDQPWQTPVQISETVLPALFGQGKPVGPNKIGYHLGWITMDAPSAKEYRDIWITNFPNDLDYCTITVKSGLDASVAPDQVYRVLRGSTITIPGVIYDTNKEDKFLGWKADKDGKIYIQTNTYKVTTDVTFTAQWSDQIQTPVTVVWKDADDLDGIRPDELLITYNTTYTERICADENWVVLLSGTLKGAPSVNIPDGYTCDVTGSQGRTRYTITMIHTPDVSVDASGTVVWEDEDDADGIRPDEVTLRLYANGKFLTEGSASAQNGWTFDLGTYPRYYEGERVVYRLTQDEIILYEGANMSGYSTLIEEISGERGAITGYTVTNIHDTSVSVVYANIEWDDNGDADGKRPESVTVRWMLNGEVIQEDIVRPDSDGNWIVALRITYVEMKKIEAKQAELAQRYQDGEITEEEFIAQLEKIVCYTVEQDPVTDYVTTVTLVNKEDPEDSRGRIGYFSIVNKYEKHVHGMTPTEAKDPGCEEDGNTAYWTCDVGEKACGKFFSDPEGENEIEKDSWVVPALGHDWGAWEVSTQASDSHNGEETRTCGRCDKAETKEFFYIFVDGEAKQWIMGSTEDITYTFRRSPEDEKTFENFTGILVDGKPVSEESYTAEEGSVIVTLKASYLATLGAGKHTMTAVFADGSKNAPFYVIDPSVPATGTGSGIPLRMVTIVCALVSMILIFIRRKRMASRLK